MRYLDMQSWSRRNHFETFISFEQPHGGLSANVDLTSFYPAVKQSDYSFTVAIVYVLTKVLNAIPEFRYRIRDGAVVEHEVVHPSITVLTAGDLFSFCTFDYSGDFSVFADNAMEKMAFVQEHPTLEDEKGRDDLLFMTAIPWVSFTGIVHAMYKQTSDSFPRIAWGKFFEDGKYLKMPLAVQGHHALIDGIHMGKFYEEAQAMFHHPGSYLD